MIKELEHRGLTVSTRVAIHIIGRTCFARWVDRGIGHEGNKGRQCEVVERKQEA